MIGLGVSMSSIVDHENRKIRRKSYLFIVIMIINELKESIIVLTSGKEKSHQNQSDMIHLHLKNIFSIHSIIKFLNMTNY